MSTNIKDRFVPLFLSGVFFLLVWLAGETRSQSNEEKLNGKTVIIRVYPDCKQDESTFERVPIQLQGTKISFSSIKPAPQQVGEFTVVVLLGDDQQDPVVREAIGDYICALRYSKGGEFFIYPHETNDEYWNFRDALDNPIPQARVQIFLSKSGLDGWRILLCERQLDNLGQMRKLSRLPGGWEFYLTVAHEDYGIAVIEPTLTESKTTFVLPFGQAGSEADERTAWGIVLDPDGNPVAGASVFFDVVRFGGYVCGTVPINAVRTVLTDEHGSFSLYPALEKGVTITGSIPLKAEYSITVKAPAELGLLPYRAEIPIRREVQITLQRASDFRAFVFKDKNGQVIDSDTRKHICVYYRKSAEEPERQVGLNEWINDGRFLLGTYRAEMSDGEKKCKFKPIKLTDDSPKELVFEMSKGIKSYYGQVVNGITGEPMKGAFVAAMTDEFSSHHSYKVTSDQWQAMHELPDRPYLGEPALIPLVKMYGIEDVVRTNENGQFEINSMPVKNDWSGIAVLQQEYLGYFVRYSRLQTPDDGIVQVPIIKLFPSATVTIQVSAQTFISQISTCWQIDKNENPLWVNELLNYYSRIGGELVYDRSLEVNKLQSFKVPANVTLRIMLYCHPDNKVATPHIIDRLLKLKQGQTIDLGTCVFELKLNVCVKVINSVGEGVAGVPVRDVPGRGYGVCHVTDANGVAKFYVNPRSSGQFVVQFHEDSTDPNSTSFRAAAPYDVNGLEDEGKHFILALPDEVFNALFR